MVTTTYQLRLSSGGCSTHLEGLNVSPPLSDTESLRTRLLDLALGVVDLIQNFRRSSTDVSRINVICCPVMYLAMDIFIDVDNFWSAGDGNRRHDWQITEICIVLRAMARRSPWAIKILRTAQLDHRCRGVKMPEATLKLFEEFETSDIMLWKEKVSHTSMLSHLDLGFSDDGQERSEHVP